MQAIDFQTSFLSFTIDLDKKAPGTLTHEPPYALNTARIQLECSLQLTERSTGRQQRFVLGASCKTEVVGAKQDLFLEPNADFCPIFDDDGYLLIKTYAKADTQVEFAPPFSGPQPDRQIGRHDDTYEKWSINVRERDAELLTSPQQIVNATLEGRALVARTEVSHGDVSAVIEYPIKTMNGNERDWVYQTDTGPILFPDFAAAWDEMQSNLQLAFSAFNCPEWIQVIVRRPTQIAEGVNVYHYCDSVRFDAKNEVLRLL